MPISANVSEWAPNEASILSKFASDREPHSPLAADDTCNVYFSSLSKKALNGARSSMQKRFNCGDEFSMTVADEGDMVF